MAVITFSRTFPSYHKRAGDKTFFVERILTGLGIDWNTSQYLESLMLWNKDRLESGKLTALQVKAFWVSLEDKVGGIKLHTIRAGDNWQAGETFSPRAWSGVPYYSPQIAFAPEQRIINVPHIEISYQRGPFSLYNSDGLMRPDKQALLPKCDGLTAEDFESWFFDSPSAKKGKWFKGQVIIWHDGINY